MPEGTSTYRVVGTRKYRGVNPGGTLTGDPEDAAIQRALARGAIGPADGRGEEGDGLDDKTRDELNRIALAAGIEAPENIENKAAVVQAIRDKDKE
jgi:hypothetical protein